MIKGHKQLQMIQVDCEVLEIHDYVIKVGAQSRSLLEWIENWVGTLILTMTLIVSLAQFHALNTKLTFVYTNYILFKIWFVHLKIVPVYIACSKSPTARSRLWRKYKIVCMSLSPQLPTVGARVSPCSSCSLISPPQVLTCVLSLTNKLYTDRLGAAAALVPTRVSLQVVSSPLTCQEIPQQGRRRHQEETTHTAHNALWHMHILLIVLFVWR